MNQTLAFVFTKMGAASSKERIVPSIVIAPTETSARSIVAMMQVDVSWRRIPVTMETPAPQEHVTQSKAAWFKISKTVSSAKMAIYVASTVLASMVSVPPRRHSNAKPRIPAIWRASVTQPRANARLPWLKMALFVTTKTIALNQTHAKPALVLAAFH
jgi:hypothetical protein